MRARNWDFCLGAHAGGGGGMLIGVVCGSDLYVFVFKGLFAWFVCVCLFLHGLLICLCVGFVR